MSKPFAESMAVTSKVIMSGIRSPSLNARYPLPILGLTVISVGETHALTAWERQGYLLFKSFGCASCHQGMNVGGNMYQKLGVMAPYFADRGHITKADRGCFNVTGDPQDMYMFKVPSLRNVELTPPYFHDGSAATLPDAVRMMAKYQLGRHLTDQEVDSIVEFLKTLTGELNGKPL
jgi:cytochrome c peroxidase